MAAERNPIALEFSAALLFLLSLSICKPVNCANLIGMGKVVRVEADSEGRHPASRVL